ncbi:hypothetical protein ACMX2H_02865 [Arthrobacter sulfonylureivorans]|uniref:hypothetical protein n=1 Tax=Arthrobacter sulfonylureivorans TaxID=2486855 RepID=UPI0039E5D7D0
MTSRAEITEIQVYARVEEVDVEGRRVLLDCTTASSPTLRRLINESHQQLRNRWRRSFRLTEDPAAPSMDLLTEVPTAIVTARVDNLMRWQELMAEATWLQLPLPTNALNTEEPVTVGADDFEVVSPREAKKLSAILDMVNWPRVTAPRLRGVLDSIPTVEGVIVHDVGQGSANALFDSSGKAVVYFDVGRGGKGTSAPVNLDLCDCSTPLVLLSHWDRDHWAAAKDGKQGLLKSCWVVPSQKIAGTHAKFAALILQQGGSIFVVKRSSKPGKDLPYGQRIYLKYGKGADRNNSGLTLTLTCAISCPSHTMFFPGDARYDMCEEPPHKVALLVASHHGADPGGTSNLPRPASGRRSRLVYSFGPKNGYKHPFKKALTAHGSQGWNHTGWNHSKWNLSPQTGNVRATYTDSDANRQSILFSSGNCSPAAHFRAVHGETLLS